MKVTLMKVTDKDNNPKDERIWGTERELAVGRVAWLTYLDDSGTRRTSTVEKVEILDNEITIHTLNSIYIMELLVE